MRRFDEVEVVDETLPPYLKLLPVNEIKIDKSFSIGMMEHSASASVSKSSPKELRTGKRGIGL